VSRIVALEKLTRTQLLSLVKDCGIRLKAQYRLNKVDIIRKIRKSKIEDKKLQDIFLQYVNLYYCEFCRQDHYFNSDIGKRHLNYLKELKAERKRAVIQKTNRSKNKHVICKYCGKKYMDRYFLKKHINNTHFIPIDLHRMPLKDAIIHVESKLKEYIALGVGGLKLIHGYHHGTTLRDYFRSEKFKIDMKRVGFIINVSNIRDLSYTLIRINMEKLQ